MIYDGCRLSFDFDISLSTYLHCYLIVHGGVEYIQYRHEYGYLYSTGIHIYLNLSVPNFKNGIFENFEIFSDGQRISASLLARHVIVKLSLDVYQRSTGFATDCDHLQQISSFSLRQPVLVLILVLHTHEIHTNDSTWSITLLNRSPSFLTTTNGCSN